MSKIVMDKIGKIYKNGVKAVDNFSLEIDEHDFIVLVGPSGCGKSTVLRMVAGLEEITEGNLILDNKKMNDVAARDRDIAMVFQNYALYPHMSVYDNLAFCLKQRKLPKAEIDEAVRNAASKLGIENLLNRKPKTLSGGEKQRVAMGRAIVRKPKLFLMDEPLSNLDAQLRTKMRREIALLHRELKATVIYVTHDQVEAMTLGTKIVVMKGGKIQQVDTPENLYRTPANLFVAGFTGLPQMNFIDEGIFTSNLIVLDREQQKTLYDCMQFSDIVVGVRAEDIIMEKYHEGFLVKDIEMQGAEKYAYVQTGERKEILVRIDDRDNPVSQGGRVRLRFRENSLHIFDKKNEGRINSIMER